MGPSVLWPVLSKEDILFLLLHLYLCVSATLFLLWFNDTYNDIMKRRRSNKRDRTKSKLCIYWNYSQSHSKGWQRRQLSCVPVSLGTTSPFTSSPPATTVILSQSSPRVCACWSCQGKGEQRYTLSTLSSCYVVRSAVLLPIGSFGGRSAENCGGWWWVGQGGALWAWWLDGNYPPRVGAFQSHRGEGRTEMHAI